MDAYRNIKLKLDSDPLNRKLMDMLELELKELFEQTGEGRLNSSIIISYDGEI